MMKIASTADTKESLLSKPDGKEINTGPQFQPGDHVIRWKLLKFMIWPIQVHGIVLSVEECCEESCNNTDDCDNGCIRNQPQHFKYTIADFGYTSSQESMDKSNNDAGGVKNPMWKKIGSINDKMRNFYNTTRASMNDTPISSYPVIGPKDAYMNINQNPSFEGNRTNITKDERDIVTEQEFISNQFDVENESSTGNNRFQVIEITNLHELKKWHKIDYGKSLLKNTKLKETVTNSGKKLLKKLNFRKNKTENYSTIAQDQNGVGSSAIPQSFNDNAPKLPKSDPRKIVMARTRYILDEQELPESEQTLPPYHILYSNSECIAVWCKTGKFSTLQAAVFLHSTAVGNAKSTFLMTGAVVATQPWLIPVVGMYGVVGVGAPYLILKKCKERWLQSELKMTDGFWSTAANDIFVAAVENWSSIDAEKKDNHASNHNALDV